jgi:hypothetical protein
MRLRRRAPCPRGVCRSASHIFAVGDAIVFDQGASVPDPKARFVGRPELTPVAIMAGRKLARRLLKSTQEKMDYHLVPTTVFTPLEYGSTGLSQEEAERTVGSANLAVYVSRFGALEGACTQQHQPPFLVFTCLPLVCSRVPATPPLTVVSISISFSHSLPAGCPAASGTEYELPPPRSSCFTGKNLFYRNYELKNVR